MAMVDCVVVGSLLIVPAIPSLPPCTDVMDRTINAYNRALIFERHRAGSRHE